MLQNNTQTTKPDRDELDDTRARLVFAELHAVELLEIVREALGGAPKWRPRARQLVRAIDNRELP